MLFYRKDIFYSLVVDWALLGILIKRLTVDIVRIQSIITIVCLGLIIISSGNNYPNNKKESLLKNRIMLVITTIRKLFPSALFFSQ